MSLLSFLVIFCITLTSATQIKVEVDEWYKTEFLTIAKESDRYLNIAKNKIVENLEALKRKQDQISNAIYELNENIPTFEMEKARNDRKICKDFYRSQTNFSLELKKCQDGSEHMIKRTTDIITSFQSGLERKVSDRDSECHSTCQLELLNKDTVELLLKIEEDRRKGYLQEIEEITQKIKQLIQCSYRIRSEYLRELQTILNCVINARNRDPLDPW